MGLHRSAGRSEVDGGGFVDQLPALLGRGWQVDLKLVPPGPVGLLTPAFHHGVESLAVMQPDAHERAIRQWELIILAHCSILVRIMRRADSEHARLSVVDSGCTTITTCFPQRGTPAVSSASARERPTRAA